MEPEQDRDEAPGERLDRQWNELLQELRVTLTGIQLLGAFLLILPFQARFAELSDPMRVVYLTAVVSASLATFFAVAPVVAHRALFAMHRKDVLVTMAHWTTRLGLILLALTVTLGLSLIFGLVLGERQALIAGAIAAAVCTGLWWGVPALVHRRVPPEESYPPVPEPPTPEE